MEWNMTPAKGLYILSDRVPPPERINIKFLGKVYLERGEELTAEGTWEPGVHYSILIGNKMTIISGRPTDECVGSEDLINYLLDTFKNEVRSREISKHIQTCTTCQQRLVGAQWVLDSESNYLGQV